MMRQKIEKWEKKYPEKFIEENKIFSNIKGGQRIFISTGCGEPEHLVNSLIKYIEENPKAFADTEVFHIWTLGLAPYTDEKFNYNFRHNSFFIANNTRESVNTGLADFTPVFLSHIPELMKKKFIQFDVALIHTSPPDHNGFVSLGISVDISKAAIENASLIIAQVNSNMPRIHGDTFLNIKDIDYVIPYNEPLLEFTPQAPDDITQSIAKHVSRIINDGDTLQIGYGSLPNGIIKYIEGKKNLGIHTELLTDEVVELIKKGVVDNSRKSIDRGKTIATFCMGTKKTYDYLHDNPIIEFRAADYTNNPLVISRINNMTSINSALQIDLTGQASAESIGSQFYSGIGGSADFMRGTLLAPNGKTILLIQSTASDGEISRIVPFLEEGTGVTLNRGDIQYIVTEYGTAYIHGKNIRERAMDLIAIAHPKFREWLIGEAKKANLIYNDQEYIPGDKGKYPEHLETHKSTKTGIDLFLRPIKINDEPLIKDFFYSLSENSLQKRFFMKRFNIPHDMRQKFVVIDYQKDMIILAIKEENEKEIVLGMGQYFKERDKNVAEVAFAVRDDYQNQGIGTVLFSYLSMLAKKEGLQGFVAEVLTENKSMLHLINKMGFDIQRRIEGDSYELMMKF